MVQTVVRKWGNSFGIVLPKSLVRESGLDENDIVEVNVHKVTDLRSLFGRLRTDRPTQSMKDEMRAGWDG